MGHDNIAVTLDRYGHLMPGSEDEADGMLDTYLAAQSERVLDRARAATPQMSRREPRPDRSAARSAESCQ
jgi:hypothetical protein